MRVPRVVKSFIGAGDVARKHVASFEYGQRGTRKNSVTAPGHRTDSQPTHPPLQVRYGAGAQGCIGDSHSDRCQFRGRIRVVLAQWVRIRVDSNEPSLRYREFRVNAHATTLAIRRPDTPDRHSTSECGGADTCTDAHACQTMTPSSRAALATLQFSSLQRVRVSLHVSLGCFLNDYQRRRPPHVARDVVAQRPFSIDQ